jgi:hypothetical protein
VLFEAAEKDQELKVNRRPVDESSCYSNWLTDMVFRSIVYQTDLGRDGRITIKLDYIQLGKDRSSSALF